MGHRRHALGFFHLFLLGRHPEALVQVGVKNLHAIGLQLAQGFFALRFIQLLPRVQALPSAADHKQICFMAAARVNEAFREPSGPRHVSRQRHRRDCDNEEESHKRSTSAPAIR